MRFIMALVFKSSIIVRPLLIHKRSNSVYSYISKLEYLEVQYFLPLIVESESNKLYRSITHTVKDLKSNNCGDNI